MTREHALGTLTGYILGQSHISKRNMEIVGKLCASDDPVVAEAARVIWEVGRVKPARRRRFKVLCVRHPDLLSRLKASLGWPMPEATHWEDPENWLPDWDESLWPPSEWDSPGDAASLSKLPSTTEEPNDGRGLPSRQGSG